MITLSQCRFAIAFLLSSFLLFTSSTLYSEETINESLTEQYATNFWNSFNTELSPDTLELYLSNWDENAERITPTLHAVGKQAIRETYESYLSAYSEFHQTELRRIVDGNIVVSELMTTAREKESGVSLSIPNVAIVEFNNKGKVVRARVYFDTKKFALPGSDVPLKCE